MSRDYKIGENIKNQVLKCLETSYNEGYKDGYDKGYEEAKRDITKSFRKSEWFLPDDSEKCCVAEEPSNKPRSCLNCFNCSKSLTAIGQWFWKCNFGEGIILGDNEKQVASHPTCNFYIEC